MIPAYSLGQIAELNQRYISGHRLRYEYEQRQAAREHFAQYASMSPAQLEAELETQRREQIGKRRAKYDAVLACWRDHPDWRYRRIAEACGVSERYVGMCVNEWRKGAITND